jgi:hypothetical protein
LTFILFFCATDLSCLVSLPTEDGGLYHIVADVSFTLEDGTQIVYFYGDQSIVSTESSAVNTDDTQSFSDVIASNVGIVAAVVVAAVVVANSGSGDDDGDDDKLSFSFTAAVSLNSCIKFLYLNGINSISAIVQCKTPVYSKLKGSTIISRIPPSFAFFQTIDSNRIIVGNVIVF